MSKGAICFVTLAACVAAAIAETPGFTSVQPELFAAPQALSNAFADFDDDGDLDLAVSFESGAIRLYRNDANTFVEVGARLGLPTAGPQVRGLSWGDFDGDGDLDLHAGVSGAEAVPARNLLFRNDGGKAFAEVAKDLGLVVPEADSRQANWVDYDRDGDLDLFSAQRSAINRMFRNDGGRFTDVSQELGLADPRRTVGSCWFDLDQDGDLDVFQANQQADKDTLYRNDGATFTDIAPQLGMHQPERTLAEGGVGCTVGDYDNDGLLDLFVATYGTTLLYRNLGGGKFREVAADADVQQKLHAVGASWGDVDNDGYLDLYVAAYVDGENWVSRAHLFMNQQGKFVDVLSEDSPLRAADHGVQWADFDRDGDLDLSLTDDFPENGRHPLFRNELPQEVASRSLQVQVLDREGRATQAGAEVRLYGMGGKLLGTRLVPTGDGYGSQSAVPVHFGLAKSEAVTVEVTFLTLKGRKQKRIEGVDPREWVGRALVVKAD
jgi:VCBS repeat protein/ASPIC/UnbV protein